MRGVQPGRRERGLGFTVDDLELEAHLAGECGRGIRRRFSAARHASVAISRARVTLRLRILSRQIASAETARAIAASLMRPEVDTPSPRRMMRENASTTRKLVAGRAGNQEPAIVGAEIKRRIGDRCLARRRHADSRKGSVDPSGSAVCGARSWAGSRAAGCPAPRPSSNSFLPRRERSLAQRPQLVPNQDRIKCNTRACSRNRCALSAWPGATSLSRRLASFISKAAPPALVRRRGRPDPWSSSPAADRLAGDLLIKALLDESAKRSAGLRRHEIRHRAAGAPQRRPILVRGGGAATPTTSSSPARPMRSSSAAAFPTA